RRGGPGGDRRGPPRGRMGGGGSGASTANVAPADGSDKPQEATPGAEAPKSTVKRVPRKTAAAPAGNVSGTGAAPTDGKGE
ncbi:MAG TPA: hypothetical protein VFE74_04005, partial [Ramlibacter sp.]|nr:hypothetical protein [Ramlibacter sp.]